MFAAVEPNARELAEQAGARHMSPSVLGVKRPLVYRRVRSDELLYRDGLQRIDEFCETVDGVESETDARPKSETGVQPTATAVPS